MGAGGNVLEEGFHFEGSFLEFLLGEGALDDTGAGVEAGVVLLDKGAAEADDEVAVVVGIEPAEEAGEEASRERFERGNVG